MSWPILRTAEGVVGDDAIGKVLSGIIPVGVSFGEPLGEPLKYDASEGGATSASRSSSLELDF
jgi:hypothetical protein